MSDYAVANILDLMDAVGEEELQSLLSGFLCPKNTEIEIFVRKNAIEFAKRKVSITYFIIDDLGRIAAMFALTHKAVQIRGNEVSASIRKRLQRYAQVDVETGELTLSAFLIGQFGKNYQYADMTELEGKRLMTAVFEILQHVQREIGGGVVYLECEEKPQLLSFYQNENNRFRPFGNRFSENENVKYIQMLRLF